MLELFLSEERWHIMCLPLVLSCHIFIIILMNLYMIVFNKVLYISDRKSLDVDQRFVKYSVFTKMCALDLFFIAWWLMNIFFFQVFRKFGVEKYDPINEQFDPNRHLAVFQIPNASKPPGSVAAVLKVCIVYIYFNLKQLTWRSMTYIPM